MEADARRSHEKKGADPSPSTYRSLSAKRAVATRKFGTTASGHCATALIRHHDTEPKVIRILNSYCHRSGKTYTQGLNNILGPFLVCMNEMDAFFAFERLLGRITPTYWMTYSERPRPREAFPASRASTSARAACRLADKILIEVDSEPHGALMSSFARGMPFGPLRIIFTKCTRFDTCKCFQPLSKAPRSCSALGSFFRTGLSGARRWVCCTAPARATGCWIRPSISTTHRQTHGPNSTLGPSSLSSPAIAPKLSAGSSASSGRTRPMRACRELVTWRDTTEQKTQKQRRQRAKSADKSSLQGSVGAARAQMHLRFWFRPRSFCRNGQRWMQFVTMLGKVIIRYFGGV